MSPEEIEDYCHSWMFGPKYNILVSIHRIFGGFRVRDLTIIQIPIKYREKCKAGSIKYLLRAAFRFHDIFG